MCKCYMKYSGELMVGKTTPTSTLQPRDTGCATIRHQFLAHMASESIFGFQTASTAFTDKFHENFVFGVNCL